MEIKMEICLSEQKLQGVKCLPPLTDQRPQ